MAEDLFSVFKRLPLLEGVDDTYLQKLSQHAQHKFYDRKQLVFKKGDMAAELYFLIEGQLQIIDTSSDGKDVGLSMIYPSTAFGHLALIDELPRSTAVMAVQKSAVVTLHKPQVMQLLFDHPMVMYRLLKELTAIIRNTNNARSVLSQHNASSRVYAILVNMMKTNVAGLTVIEGLPRQQDLAIMANTSRETVSRAIGSLVNKGIVEKDLRSLIVRQPNQLKALSAEAGD